MSHSASPDDYRGDLIRVAHRLLPAHLRPKAADSDLVQDTLLAAWASRDRAPGPPAAYKSWLRGILRKHIGRLHRRYVTAAKRSVQAEQPLGDLAPVPDPRAATATDGLSQDEMIAALRAATGRLRPHERDVLAWRLEDDLSWEQIAARLGSSEEAARKVFARTLGQLRRRLAAHSGPTGA